GLNPPLGHAVRVVQHEPIAMAHDLQHFRACPRRGTASGSPCRRRSCRLSRSCPAAGAAETAEFASIELSPPNSSAGNVTRPPPASALRAPPPKNAAAVRIRVVITELYRRRRKGVRQVSMHSLLKPKTGKVHLLSAAEIEPALKAGRDRAVREADRVKATR